MFTILNRIKYITLFLITLPFLLFRPKKREIRRVLIIQGSTIGDMICHTPLFRELKKQYPNVHLVVQGSEVNKQVVEGNPYIDEYLSTPKSLASVVKCYKSLKPDIIITTSPSFYYIAASIISGVPRVVGPTIVGGHCPHYTKPYKMLMKHIETVTHTMGEYAPREYLRALEPLGINSKNSTKDVYIKSEDKDSVNTLFFENKIDSNSFVVGILPGVGNPIKEWSSSKFAELINHIKREYPNIVFILLGAKKDNVITSRVLKGLKSDINIKNFVGGLTVEELKATINRLNMLIGVDTGPQFIAEALNIPTIDIVGPVSENEQPPNGKFHHTVSVERKEAAIHIMNTREVDEVEARRQVDDITEEIVFESFVILYNLINDSKQG